MVGCGQSCDTGLRNCIECSSRPDDSTQRIHMVLGRYIRLLPVHGAVYSTIFPTTNMAEYTDNLRRREIKVPEQYESEKRCRTICTEPERRLARILSSGTTKHRKPFTSKKPHTFSVRNLSDRGTSKAGRIKKATSKRRHSHWLTDGKRNKILRS